MFLAAPYAMYNQRNASPAPQKSLKNFQEAKPQHSPPPAFFSSPCTSSCCFHPVLVLLVPPPVAKSRPESKKSGTSRASAEAAQETKFAKGGGKGRAISCKGRSYQGKTAKGAKQNGKRKLVRTWLQYIINVFQQVHSDAETRDKVGR